MVVFPISRNRRRCADLDRWDPKSMQTGLWKRNGARLRYISPFNRQSPRSGAAGPKPWRANQAQFPSRFFASLCRQARRINPAKNRRINPQHACCTHQSDVNLFAYPDRRCARPLIDIRIGRRQPAPLHAIDVNVKQRSRAVRRGNGRRVAPIRQRPRSAASRAVACRRGHRVCRRRCWQRAGLAARSAWHAGAGR